MCVCFRITETFDTGLLDAWKEDYSVKPKFCKIIHPDDVVHPDYVALTLKAVTGPFILISIGLIASLLGFAFELRRLIWPKKERHDNLKQHDSSFSDAIFVVSSKSSSPTKVHKPTSGTERLMSVV